MLLWRLIKPAYAPGLDGEGARLEGGRWNSPGNAVVYMASSLALAALEYFVHLHPALRTKATLPHLIAVGLLVPDTLVSPLSPPVYGIPDCRAAGDAWFKARTSLALIVPSHVIPRESNVILNPAHPGMAQVSVQVSEEFEYDDRLGT